MHRILHFTRDAKLYPCEYIVILEDGSVDDPLDHCRNGWELANEVEVEGDLHMLPLGDALTKD